MKIFLIFLFLTLLPVIGVSATTPNSARLNEVKERIIPKLRKAFEEKGLKFGSAVFIRIFKEEKELEVWIKNDKKFKLFRTYPICYFSGDLGPKLKTGDGQSPEGFYFVNSSRMNPNSRFHLSFNIGFPNKYDREHGRTGSFLMVHGNCVSIGCYAMRDKNIEEIYVIADASLGSKQPFFRIHIFPFRMTDKNMKMHTNPSSALSKPQWKDFWENLKEGYDYFEKHKRPPNVEVENKRYVFE